MFLKIQFLLINGDWKLNFLNVSWTNFQVLWTQDSWCQYYGTGVTSTVRDSKIVLNILMIVFSLLCIQKGISKIGYFVSNKGQRYYISVYLIDIGDNFSISPIRLRFYINIPSKFVNYFERGKWKSSFLVKPKKSLSTKL